MKPSKYLEKFVRLANSASKPFKLIADYILIERINDEEFTRKSGLIIPLSTRTDQLNSVGVGKPHWARVLFNGEGYYNDATGEAVPLDVKPGDIILLSSLSARYFSVFGDLESYEADGIGISKESEIQGVIDGEGGYKRMFACLNESPEEEVVEGA